MNMSHRPSPTVKVVDAIRFNGMNHTEIAEWATGEYQKPYTLPKGFWQRKQENDTWSYAVPGMCGEVYLFPGDWYVMCEGGIGFLRLTDEEMQSIAPELRQQRLKNAE